MNALLSIFADIDDPRDCNARHDLSAMLFISLAATLCGAKSCVDIADFAAAMTDSGIEATFLHFWQSQPASAQHSLPKILVAFVQTDLFLKRQVSP